MGIGINGLSIAREARATDTNKNIVTSVTQIWFFCLLCLKIMIGKFTPSGQHREKIAKFFLRFLRYKSKYVDSFLLRCYETFYAILKQKTGNIFGMAAMPLPLWFGDCMPACLGLYRNEPLYLF